MGLCLQCKKWVTQTKGKKAKLFCNDTCRSNYRYAKNKKEKAENIIQFQKATPEAYNGSKFDAKKVEDEGLSFDRMKQEMAVPATTNDFFDQMNRAEDLEELEAIGRRIKASGMSWKEQQQYHNFGKMIAQKKFID